MMKSISFKRNLAIIFLWTLLAAACGGGEQADDAGNGGTAGGTGEAQTFNVNVDAKSEKFNLATTAYFPNELSVHPGDTVEFKEIFTGEPHTVTFGKLVDDGLAAIDKMKPPGGPGGGAPPGGGEGPPGGGESPGGAQAAPPGGEAPPGGGEGGGGPGGEPPPEMKKLPDLFGPPPTFQGMNQSAGQACFLETGEPPVTPPGSAPACPKVEQPEFDGNQAFYNSGYLAEDETFSVKFAEDTKPGTYQYFCLLHRDIMRGKVTVAAADSDIPAPDQVEEKGKEQLSKMEQAFTKVHEDMQKATADKAMAGAGSRDVMDALLAEFGPEEVSVPSGGSVSWTLFGFHTIAFNSPQDAIGDIIQESDGSVRQNDKATQPSKAPNPPPPAFGPGAKPASVQATWDGTGYFNSGQMASFPDAPVTYQVRFTKAGTYNLQCNLHPDMKGTVKVG